jgi:hypothetical protein
MGYANADHWAMAHRLPEHDTIGRCVHKTPTRGGDRAMLRFIEEDLQESPH